MGYRSIEETHAQNKRDIEQAGRKIRMAMLRDTILFTALCAAIAIGTVLWMALDFSASTGR